MQVFMQRITMILLLAVVIISSLQCSKSSPVEPDKNDYEIIVEANKAFELFNIAIAMTPSYKHDQNYVNHKTAYYQEMLTHFEAVSNHKLIGMLEYYPQDINPEMNTIKDMSLLCEFNSNDSLELIPEATSLLPPFVMPFMTELVASANSFIADSDFHVFYETHQTHYQKCVQFFENTIDIETMWAWLEEHFSIAYDIYYIPLSPLTGGSHYTRQDEIEGKRTLIMVVSGPESVVTGPVQIGDYTRRLFTEVDHNYVNPISNMVLDEINQSLPNLTLWNKQTNYQSAYLTFNEYMTWALFSAYAQEQYDASTAQSIIDDQVKLMVEQRRFVRFKEFNTQFLKVWADYDVKQPVESLFKPMLEWMQNEES